MKVKFMIVLSLNKKFCSYPELCYHVKLVELLIFNKATDQSAFFLFNL